MTEIEAESRALDLFEQLLSDPGNPRHRARLLRDEPPAVQALVLRLEAGHAARAILPTELPESSAPTAFHPPERIGPFRLAERIGAGGLGEVWRAERDDGRFEQTVAIKFLNLHGDERAASAFDSERRILARLDHPDIVRLRDGGETSEGQPYLIMDHVAGAPIDVVAQSLPIAARIALFLQVAHVVQFSHGRLIAHGDIKPSNILVDADGRVHLLDFGIAGLLHGDSDALPPSGAMTRAFASPQRIAGAPPSVLDDVFALGRLLAVLIGEAVDADGRALLARATAEDESARYDSVSALAADVTAWQGGLPVAARNGGVSYRMAKFVGRNRIAVAATACAAVALVCTTGYALWNAQRAETARAEATARYKDAHGIASYLMFDVMARMANQPRSLALRANMAARAQSYLDRLAQLPMADDAARLDTARGFWQLAAFQLKSGHPNLGQADAARANLLTAERMSRSLTSPEAQLLLARILLDRASNAANADNDLDLADRLIAQAKPLVDRTARLDPVVQKIYFHQLANLRSWQGRYAEERVAAEAGLALPPLADPLREFDLRDALLDIAGDSYLNTGDRASALKVYTEQVEKAVAARARWPEDRMIVSRLMYARLNLGVILNALDRLPEALSVLTTASEEAAEQYAFEPADRWTEAQLSSIEGARAQTLGFMGRYDEAMAIMQNSADRKRETWEQDPDEMRMFRAYVQARALIGEAQARNRHFVEQCRTDTETFDLYQQMAKRGALTKWDEDINFKELKSRLATHCGKRF